MSRRNMRALRLIIPISWLHGWISDQSFRFHNKRSLDSGEPMSKESLPIAHRSAANLWRDIAVWIPRSYLTAMQREDEKERVRWRKTARGCFSPCPCWGKWWWIAPGRTMRSFSRAATKPPVASRCRSGAVPLFTPPSLFFRFRVFRDCKRERRIPECTGWLDDAVSRVRIERTLRVAVSLRWVRILETRVGAEENAEEMWEPSRLGKGSTWLPRHVEIARAHRRAREPRVRVHWN